MFNVDAEKRICTRPALVAGQESRECFVNLISDVEICGGGGNLYVFLLVRGWKDGDRG